MLFHVELSVKTRTHTLLAFLSAFKGGTRVGIFTNTNALARADLNSEARSPKGRYTEYKTDF